MPDVITKSRRAFLGAAGAAVAALTPASSQSVNKAPTAALQTDPNTSFSSLKQIDAGLLNVGYVEDGGRWPRGHPLAWLAVRHSQLRRCRPLLASAGYRVIVPYLRGYGSTRFLSNETFRNGQQSAVAIDVIALMDALKIGKAILGRLRLGGADGAIIAALWPER